MSQNSKNIYVEAWQKGVRLSHDITERKKIIAERLRITRIQAGLKQKDIALKADINASTYSGYENEVGSPTIEVLIRIADAYRISLDYLTGRTDNLYGIQPPEAENEVHLPSNVELVQRIEKLEQMINNQKSDE